MLLINVKMSSIFGILTFYEQDGFHYHTEFITLGPVYKILVSVTFSMILQAVLCPIW